jgi:hypothetical protein
MGILKIDDLADLHSGDREPFQSWKWSLVSFPEIGGFTLPPSYCEEIGLPFPAFATKQKEIAGTTVTFPGNTSIDSFEMIMYEDSVLSSIAYIQDWQSLVQNPRTGGYRTPSHYWKDFAVELYNNKNEVAATSTIRNVWPISLGNPQLNQETGRLRVNVQFVCTAQIFLPSKRINFSG